MNNAKLRTPFRAILAFTACLLLYGIASTQNEPEVAQQQLRHSNARTTLGYVHLRGGITEQAMADVSNSLRLDAVGRGQGKGSPYLQ
jgi:Tfp pilus assembly protein PilF